MISTHKGEQVVIFRGPAVHAAFPESDISRGTLAFPWDTQLMIGGKKCFNH